MKTFGTILILAVITMASAIPAYFTGQSENFTSVTGKPGIRCQYRTGDGRTFWLTYSGWTCPQSVDYQ